MKNYVIHATVKKYDIGLEAKTKANATVTVKAENESMAESKAKSGLINDYSHPMIKNIEVEIDIIKEI